MVVEEGTEDVHFEIIVCEYAAFDRNRSLQSTELEIQILDLPDFWAVWLCLGLIVSEQLIAFKCQVCVKLLLFSL